MRKLKEVFIDVETTGLDPESDKVTEFAAIYRLNGKIKARTFIDKDIPRNVKLFLSEIIDPYDASDKGYFLAYNTKFDKDFIFKLLKSQNTNFGNYFHHMPVDVMQLAAYKFMQKGIVPENFKLATVAKQMGITVNDNRLHNAAYDIDITKQLFNKLKKL